MAALRAYIDGGHALHFETVHGEDECDNRITSTVTDWNAFVKVLEPGAGTTG